uniref:Uncharacterized protein n=1 Tax=viral metagenome TaxID=1070528 RepID=A0A6M3JFK7_9ZZZZ
MPDPEPIKTSLNIVQGLRAWSARKVGNLLVVTYYDPKALIEIPPEHVELFKALMQEKILG